MDNPIFKARFLTDGSTALHCKQTNVRYIIAKAGADHATYREGQLIRTGSRGECIDAVESDARWALRFCDRIIELIAEGELDAW